MSTVGFWVPCAYLWPPRMSLNMIPSIVFGQPHELSALYWCYGHFGAQFFWVICFFLPLPPRSFHCVLRTSMIFSMHVTTVHLSSEFCFTLLCYIICSQGADRDGTDEPQIRLYWIFKLRRCKHA
jgi:hypothetical protein